MMKKIFIMFALALLILPLASSEVRFWQTKEIEGNGTIENRLVVDYSKDGFGKAEDYVTGNNFYEVSLLYNIYVKSFNEANPTHQVNYCEWKISYATSLENTSQVLLHVNYTEEDDDILNAQYYKRMSDGDTMFVDQICHFTNLTYNQFNMPAEVQLVTPTWECKACQYYEWSVVERDIAKADAIGDNVVTVSDYIKDLFLLNVEIWLAFFWVILILAVFLSISMIFVLMYWMFLYLTRLMK